MFVSFTKVPFLTHNWS